MIAWEREAEGIRVLLDGRSVGTIEPAEGATDELAEADAGVLRWTRRWREPMTEATLRFTADYAMTWSMVPAVQYDGNRCFIRDYQQVRADSPLNHEQVDTSHRTYVLGHTDPATGEPNRISWKRSSIPCATYS